MKVGDNVPADNWNITEKVEPNSINDGGVGDGHSRNCTWVDEIDAPDGPTAERRVFEFIAHNYEDSASDYEYIAIAEVNPGRWRVRVNAPGEY